MSFSALAVFFKTENLEQRLSLPHAHTYLDAINEKKRTCELFLKPHNLPSSCISLETLFTSSCDRPSVMTTKTFGMPLLIPASPVNKISRACLMALPAKQRWTLTVTQIPFPLASHITCYTYIKREICCVLSSLSIYSFCIC